MVLLDRIELSTSPLPRECSTTEPHGQKFSQDKKNPQSIYCGAGEGNRTLVISLEGFCSTIELHPLKPINTQTKTYLITTNFNWWRGKDSNLRRRKSTDLQSVAFDRSATPPLKSLLRKKNFSLFYLTTAIRTYFSYNVNKFFMKC